MDGQCNDYRREFASKKQKRVVTYQGSGITDSQYSGKHIGHAQLSEGAVNRGFFANPSKEGIGIYDAVQSLLATKRRHQILLKPTNTIARRVHRGETTSTLRQPWSKSLVWLVAVGGQASVFPGQPELKSVC